MAPHETFRPAFNEQAASLPFMPVDPSLLPTPSISYGLPFPEACAKHVRSTFGSSRVYIICSGTLSRNTNALQRLIDALGKDHVVGVRKGMAPHTLWSQIIEIVTEAREAKADCLVTLGAGSLTDGAKISWFQEPLLTSLPLFPCV
jgi:alcohol dehydrogenase class IV